MDVDEYTIVVCLKTVCDMFHLAAVVLLPYKLHTSRSAAGVSLKMQELYLLVHLSRVALDFSFPFAWATYDRVMWSAKIGLTAVTIGMMRYRPSLRASYDVSLDHFRSWAHGVLPALVLTLVIWVSECAVPEEGICWFGDRISLLVCLWIFSQVLEPFAIVPQLLVFRGCTDAGRLTAVYVSLMVAYRATFLLSGAVIVFLFREEMKSGGSSGSAETSTTTSAFGPHLVEIIISTIQTVTLVAFLVDWRLRVSRRSPPGGTGDIMEPKSAARERLLPDQEGKGGYSGGGVSASRFGISDGGGAAGDEAQPSRRQRQSVEIVDRIEGVLSRERGQERPSSRHDADASASTTSSEGGMRGDSGEVYLV